MSNVTYYACDECHVEDRVMEGDCAPDSLANVLPPGWFQRDYIDRRGDRPARGRPVEQYESKRRIRHYCPECSKKLWPPSALTPRPSFADEPLDEAIANEASLDAAADHDAATIGSSGFRGTP